MLAKLKKMNTPGKILCFLMAALMLAVLSMTVLAQVDVATNVILSFESGDPVAELTVTEGTGNPDLPNTLRAVVKLTDIEASAPHTQSETAPVDAEEQTGIPVESAGTKEPTDEQPIEPDEATTPQLPPFISAIPKDTYGYQATDNGLYTYTDVMGNQASRIYGSLNGSEPGWFACDADGNVNGIVKDIPVNWVCGDYDENVAGTYTFTAEFVGYTYAGAHPFALVTIEGGISAPIPEPNQEPSPSFSEEPAQIPEPDEETGLGISPMSLEIDPEGYYLIYTAADMDAVRNDLTGKYKLCDNIDLASYISAQYGSNGWLPIGTASNPFVGTFNNAGDYTISGLQINRSTSRDQGLFGFTNGATITGVHIELASQGISAVYHAGGLVGDANNNTVIKNCTVTGGQVTVVGGGYAGGLVGRTNDIATGAPVVIENCYVYDTSVKTSGNYAGGLLGVAYGGTKVISCGTENVKVEGVSYVGGLVAALHGTSSIDQCYATKPTLNASASYAGGLVGAMYEQHLNVNTSGNISISASHVTDATVTVNTSYAGGFIGSAYEGTKITNCSVTTAVVKNTAIYNYVGGFAGEIKASTVSNCHIKNATVTCRGSYVGGFSSVIYAGSSVADCSAQNVEVSSTYYTGGFVGSVYGNSPITNSYATGKASNTSGYIVGGLAGEATNATITNCYAQVDVKSSSTSTGGLVGYAEGATTIRNSYANGNVNGGTSDAGGLVGTVAATMSGSIQNCYATGTVTGSGNTGGLIGYNYKANLPVSNCYYDTTTTRQSVPSRGSSISGSATGLATEQMINGSSIAFAYQLHGSGSGSSPWYIDTGITYPYLYYQFDNHSVTDTNYNLASVTYNNGTLDDRTDFSAPVNPLQFQVKSAGAVKAYFPYPGFVQGSRYAINTSAASNVPGTAITNPSGLYSLGSISATGIIAFTNGSAPDGSITKVSNVDKIRIGDQYFYTISATNNGSATWENVAATDELTQGLDYVDYTSEDGVAVTHNNGILTIHFGNIPTEGSKSVVITVQVNSSAVIGETIENKVTTTDGKEGEDPDGPIVLEPTTTLTISKTVTGNFANKSKPFTFTIYFYEDAGGATPLTGSFDYYDGDPSTGTKLGTLTLDGNGSDTFDLIHGDTIYIDGVPADCYVRIVEDDYLPVFTPSFIDSNDTTSTPVYDRDTDIFAMTADSRTIAFTNDRFTSPPTGFDLSALPFVGLILLALGAFAGYVTLQSRRRKGVIR